MNQATKEVETATRAKVGILWIRSPEEKRIERNLIPLADALGYELWTWTATRGIARLGQDATNPATQQLDIALAATLKLPGRVMLLAYDPAGWLRDPLSLRAARDAHNTLPTLARDQAKQIVCVDTAGPPEGLPGLTVLDWPLPDRDACANILDSFKSWAPSEAVADLETNGTRDEIISAMIGLSAEDSANALSRSLAATGRFDAALVAQEKKRVVAGSGLEWYDPDPRGMEGIGGMDDLKDWLKARRSAYSPAAREYGLPAPKGVMLLGIPGCGKSLTAKCISAAWQLPLLRMDVGALFSKFVGESEGQIRQALQTAETIAPAVLWLDEIEKGFSGTNGSESDGGTSSRVFSTFLTWMQERQAPVFVVATANDISKLPAEFLRAGRWDEIFFIDLPSRPERRAIAQVMAAKFPNCIDTAPAEVASCSADHTGAEIEQAYIDAMFTAFTDDGRPVATADILEALRARVPLSTTMREKIDKLRDWAKGRARFASTKSAEQTTAAGRAIE